MNCFSFTYFSVFTLIYFANLSCEHSNISVQPFVPAFFLLNQMIQKLQKLDFLGVKTNKMPILNRSTCICT